MVTISMLYYVMITIFYAILCYEFDLRLLLYDSDLIIRKEIRMIMLQNTMFMLLCDVMCCAFVLLCHPVGHVT